MLEHGGNLHFAAQKYGLAQDEWLDLSTGINPQNYPLVDIPPAIWQRLPADDDGLAEVACDYYGSPFALAVAGSQAVIQVLPKLRPPSRIALLTPMYQEHEWAWRSCGHQIKSVENIHCEEVQRHADVVVVCNPNNPTATFFSTQVLLELHAKLARRGGWLIVDEAFMDATPEYSVAPYSGLPGLFVLRSIGKFFGLAGARVGFLLAQQQALELVRQAIGPWSVCGASRLLSRQALNDTTWQANTRLQLAESSQRLYTLLQQHGLMAAAGTSLFQYVPTMQAEVWQHYLAQEGIWVRRFHSPPALRLGLPPEHGWQRLEEVLFKLETKSNNFT